MRLLRAQQACAASARAGSQQRHDWERALVLVAPGKGGPRIVALNHAARDGGLAAGELLSNARSKVEGLQSDNADPAADAAALRRLALWCVRYAPVVAACDEASGADGIFIDITGAAHLKGGEAALLADLERRLKSFGLVPRLAIAGTPGVAWALARYGRGERIVVASGDEARALSALPLAALRVPAESLPLLRRLGLRRIGELIGQPRAPLAARFDGAVLTRLDQALGRAAEPLVPVLPPPAYETRVTFVEPIFSAEHVLVAAEKLLGEVMRDLAADAAGARVLRLLLFRVDGEAVSLDLGLAAPSRDAAHVAKLISLRLDQLGESLDAEFGFEAAALHVLVAEPLVDRQTSLGMDEAEARPEALAHLVDRLQQRLGHAAVRALQPHQSHIPERAVRAVSASALCAVASRAPPAHGWADHAGGMRPPLLLPRAEAVTDVLAVIPDDPPRQFRWRGVMHHVAGAQGPERIEPEWWLRTAEATRDYYLVEDTAGRRFWLYRAGLYGRDSDAPPQWFVHGVWG